MDREKVGGYVCCFLFDWLENFEVALAVLLGLRLLGQLWLFGLGLRMSRQPWLFGVGLRMPTQFWVLSLG